MKKGFTKIPNAQLELLARSSLQLYELRCLLHIYRETNGWQKESDWISYGQFSEKTGMNRQNVYRSVQRLEDRRIIVISGDYGIEHKYAINNKVSEWNLGPYSTVTPKPRLKKSRVIRRDNTPLPDEITKSVSVEITSALSPETPTKEIRKEKKEIVKEDDGLTAFRESLKDLNAQQLEKKARSQALATLR